MNTEKPNNEYIITYSNSFEFEGCLFAFRKKQLFNISNTPFLVPFKNGYWLINRKQLTIYKAKELITNKSVNIDLSNLQWYQQIKLNECFNL